MGCCSSDLLGTGHFLWKGWLVAMKGHVHWDWNSHFLLERDAHFACSKDQKVDRDLCANVDSENDADSQRAVCCTGTCHEGIHCGTGEWAWGDRWRGGRREVLGQVGLVGVDWGLSVQNSACRHCFLVSHLVWRRMSGWFRSHFYAAHRRDWQWGMYERDRYLRRPLEWMEKDDVKVEGRDHY